MPAPARHAILSRLRLALFAPLCALCACGERAAGSQDAVVRRDSAGVAMVTSYRAQWAEGAGWQVDSVPRSSLGGAEADTNQHWRYVEGSALLSDGRVVVAVDGQLRWFAAGGTHMRTTPAGDGPGEFRYTGALHALPGDSLRVHDGPGLKYAVFAPDGTLAYEVRTDADKLRALGRWTECANAYLADGSRLLCQPDASIPVTSTNRPNRRLAGGVIEPGPGLLRQLHRVWLVTPSLERAFPLSVGAGIEQFGVAEGGETEYVTHPFYSWSITAAGGEPLRIATALNPDYRIELWTPDGVLERVVMREGARRAPTAAELADVPAALRRGIRSNDPVRVERILAAVPTPDSLPAMWSISITSLGELLVMREGRLESDTQTLYDVFDREGAWLGTLRLQGRQFILSATDDSLLVLRMADDGVMLVQVYGYRR